MQNRLDDAREFFFEHPVYKSLFTLFKKKYQSLGKISGTVKVTHFSDNDLDEIASFFGSSRAELRAKGKVSLQAFEQQLGRTKFEGIGLFELLEHFFEEEILSNYEVKRQKEQFFYETFNDLIVQFPVICFWFQYLQEKSADTYWIYRLLETKKAVFIDYSRMLNEAFRQLPKDGERMAMFSQRITNNPHAFDQNRELGKLWLHLLSVNEHIQRGKDGEVRLPIESEKVSQLLESYKLFRDDITNNVTVVNIQAETLEGIHPVWEAAATRTVPSVLNVPMRELTPLTKAYPYVRSPEKTVWLVENSGVFSTIVDQFPKVPLICTHGQFKLATLKLMDLLVKEGCQLMYAGDFDPEGVLMLQRLMERYEEHVIPWRMDLTHYKASEPTVELTEERLAKLGHVTMAELAPLKDAILMEKKAGYQEAIITQYFKDL